MRKTKIKPIKVTQKELAEYLGVDFRTVSSYNNSPNAKKKLFLMLKGLQKLKEERLIWEDKAKFRLCTNRIDEIPFCASKMALISSCSKDILSLVLKSVSLNKTNRIVI